MSEESGHTIADEHDSQGTIEAENTEVEVQSTLRTEPSEGTEETRVRKSSRIPNAPRTNSYGAIRYDSSGR